MEIAEYLNGVEYTDNVVLFIVCIVFISSTLP